MTSFNDVILIGSICFTDKPLRKVNKPKQQKKQKNKQQQNKQQQPKNNNQTIISIISIKMPLQLR